ncbi:MAG: hypothetical protein ABL883_11070 [Terricaulis sp.]
MRGVLFVACLLGLAACDQGVAPGGAGAQTQAVAGALTDSDRATILLSQNLSADAAGQVENECGERVTPQFLPAEMSGAVGSATLLAMSGGPNYASCYGDGPGLTLLKREGASWRAIYSSRGGFMAILQSQTNGVRDIAFAGPGFEHPLHVWNGTVYTPAGRSVADAAMSSATMLP